MQKVRIPPKRLDIRENVLSCGFTYEWLVDTKVPLAGLEVKQEPVGSGTSAASGNMIETYARHNPQVAAAMSCVLRDVKAEEDGNLDEPYTHQQPHKTKLEKIGRIG